MLNPFASKDFSDWLDDKAAEIANDDDDATHRRISDAVVEARMFLQRGGTSVVVPPVPLRASDAPPVGGGPHPFVWREDDAVRRDLEARITLLRNPSLTEEQRAIMTVRQLAAQGPISAELLRAMTPEDFDRAIDALATTAVRVANAQSSRETELRGVRGAWIERLMRLRTAQDALAVEVDHAVEQIRLAGGTWHQIAKVFGVSVQTIQRRYNAESRAKHAARTLERNRERQAGNSGQTAKRVLK